MDVLGKSNGSGRSCLHAICASKNAVQVGGCSERNFKAYGVVSKGFHSARNVINFPNVLFSSRSSGPETPAGFFT